MVELSKFLMKKRIIVTGPTASGKSSLALKIAKKLNSEIINIDSVQLYKDLDIGSAKPNAKDLDTVKHHLIDVCNAEDNCDVFKYNTLLESTLSECDKNNIIPIITGGSTLYIKAFLEGLVNNGKTEPDFRKNLESKPSSELYKLLLNIDNKSALRIGENDKFRLVRAIELISFSNLNSLDEIFAKQKADKLKRNSLIIVLCWDRDKLYERINIRTNIMLKNGLVEEVKALLKTFSKDLNVFKTLGYKQVIDYLENSENIDLQDEISKFTRRYAKRQMTFWRNEPNKNNWEIYNDKLEYESEMLEGFNVLNVNFLDLVKEIDNYLVKEDHGVKILFINAESLWI